MIYLHKALTQVPEHQVDWRLLMRMRLPADGAHPGALAGPGPMHTGLAEGVRAAQ